MGGDLSEHFSRREFACHDNCGFDTVSPDLVKTLEWVRSLFPGSSITITSGCRCAKRNAQAKGSKPNSFHLHGMAADFVVSGISPNLVQKRLDSENYHGGVEYAPTWTHIDIGPQRRFKIT
jgi:uncharacterized protein YcbK (DUF882 family)